MIAWLRRLFSPPVFEDAEQTRKARLGVTLAYAHVSLLAVLSIGVLLAGLPNVLVVLGYVVAMAAVGLLVIFLIKSGRIALGTWLWTSLIWLSVTAFAILTDGVNGIAFFGYTLVVAIAGLLLGRGGAFIFCGACIAAGLGMVWAEGDDLLPPSIAPADPMAMWLGLSFYLGLLAVLIQSATDSLGKALDRARRSEQSLTESNVELEESRRALEGRTRDLERQTAYLQASAEVSRVATTILLPEEMIRQAAELIRMQFGLYYVGLFLLDEAGGEAGGPWAVLQSGTGEAGRLMLARGHRIKVGEGMIGRCMAEAKIEVAREAREAPGRLATAELPDTRSEAAIPLRSPGGVIGAITVQHNEPDAFDPDALAVLQTMADQLTTALTNARLMAESQAALEAERRAYGEISQRAWGQITRVSPGAGYVCDPERVREVKGELPPGMMEAGRAGKMVQIDGRTVALPVKVREQVIAVMRLSKPQDADVWTDEEVALVEGLTDQLNLAMDGARLYGDTQRRAARERLLGDVGARMRESLDMDTVLRTALQEIGRSLDLGEVEVRMGSEGTQSESTRMGSEGTQSESTQSEGTRMGSEGTRMGSEGTQSEGTQSEGTQSEGTQSESTRRR